jgi:hypothetical protein
LAYYKENKYVPSLEDYTDDELVAKIIQVMWEVKSRTKAGTDDLKKCHEEVVRRGTPHIWNRAKDCFIASTKQEPTKREY